MGLVLQKNHTQDFSPRITQCLEGILDDNLIQDVVRVGDVAYWLFCRSRVLKTRTSTTGAQCIGNLEFADSEKPGREGLIARSQCMARFPRRDENLLCDVVRISIRAKG